MMYLRFFGLFRPPFAPATAPADLFVSETHQEALSALVYGLISRKPFVVVLGEVGVGKTTVLNAALAQVGEAKLRVIRVANPLLGPGELLRLVGESLDLIEPDWPGAVDPEEIFRGVIATCRGGAQIALVVDEAQALSPETLEVLRLLSNLHTGEHGMVQTVFVGQPEFWGLIERHEFRSLRQRISIRANIMPLPRRVARDYVNHCLSVAGGSIDRVMTRAAVSSLVRNGRGIPRRINILADNTLIAGFAAGSRPVTAKIVKAAVLAIDGRQRLGDAGRPGARRWWPTLATAGLATIALVVAGRMVGPDIPVPPSAGSSMVAAVAPTPPPAATPRPAPVAAETAALGGDVVKPEPVAITLPPGRTLRYEMQAGDTVTSLLKGFYGRSDEAAVRLFLSLNPGVVAADAVAPGMVIVLPSAPAETVSAL